MATFLFWNLNRQPILDLVHAAVDEHQVDLVALAECAIPDVTLLETLNARGPRRFSFAALRPIRGPRLKVLSRYPSRCLRPVRESGRLSIWHLAPPIGFDIVMAVCHLPSKLHQRDIDQVQHCTQLVRHIAEAETKVGHERTVLFGDLNMNPFEGGVVGAAGLHAVMSREVAARGSRTVQDERRSFFYNPMWGFFGDRSPGPPGTYYYDTGRHENYYWNIYDQVLVRPSLLPMFRESEVHVLTAAGGHPLLCGNGLPSPSDHLPVLFRIHLERRVCDVS
jgi:endonuclease/exonuclease/phosphatase family metal-dependent hydrolase